MRLVITTEAQVFFFFILTPINVLRDRNRLIRKGDHLHGCAIAVVVQLYRADNTVRFASYAITKNNRTKSCISCEKVYLRPAQLAGLGNARRRCADTATKPKTRR